MSGGVWMSGIFGNHSLGADQGNRTKFYGHEWEPATSEVPVTPQEVLESMRLSGRGHALSREQLPEALAVWNEKKFRRAGEIFAVGFFVVRAKLAAVLSRFDLGEGGLVPFPVYQDDLATPYPGEFHLLNFGAVKDTLRPELCGDASKFLVERATGVQIWHINDLKPDADVVVSSAALDGPDLWAERAVYSKLFLSDALAQEIIALGLDKAFRLTKCVISDEDAPTSGLKTEGDREARYPSVPLRSC